MILRMFYLFHHMPKCGGTSFREFLKSMFDVRADYHVGNVRTHPNQFSEYIGSPVNLEELDQGDCLCGHYNFRGVRLWERYPELDRHPHKRFTILRQPLETAISGLKYGIKVGWHEEGMPYEVKERALLERANYFSLALGIRDKSEAEEVMNKYWFIAPLEKIGVAANLIASEVGRLPIPVESLNATGIREDFIDDGLKETFREAAELDTYIYDLCVSRFESMRSKLPALSG